jgi:hypothetical protein
LLLNLLVTHESMKQHIIVSAVIFSRERTDRMTCVSDRVVDLLDG